MPPIDRSFPAECLRAFRAWLGLSQDDIASILGISTRSVQMYEGQGGPEWLRYALMGWATLVHGVTPRAAARRLGLPWQHHALAEGATDAVSPRSGAVLVGPHDPPPDAYEDSEEDADLNDAPSPGEPADEERTAGLTSRRRGTS